MLCLRIFFKRLNKKDRRLLYISGCSFFIYLSHEQLVNRTAVNISSLTKNVRKKSLLRLINKHLIIFKISKQFTDILLSNTNKIESLMGVIFQHGSKIISWQLSGVYSHLF